MTGASRERISEVTETIPKKASLRAPVYSPRVEDVDLNRFMRLVKFVLTGGAVVFAIGLTVGAGLAIKIAEAHPMSAAVSVGAAALAGLMIGAFGGAVLERATRPRAR